MALKDGIYSCMPLSEAKSPANHHLSVRWLQSNCKDESYAVNSNHDRNCHCQC